MVTILLFIIYHIIYYHYLLLFIGEFLFQWTIYLVENTWNFNQWKSLFSQQVPPQFPQYRNFSLIEIKIHREIKTERTLNFQ